MPHFVFIKMIIINDDGTSGEEEWVCEWEKIEYN